MRIGIDLDNTIIRYDHTFAEVAKRMNIAIPLQIQQKTEIKRYLRSEYGESEGEILWQKIQGQVYGKQIHLAMPFEFTLEVINYFIKNNIELFIVSHKTLHGHFDESKTNLHDVALKWLENHQFTTLIPKENIFFRLTRDEKINKINELNLDYFIDDLPEILEHSQLNANIQKILFNPNQTELKINQSIQMVSSWQSIKEIILCQ